MTSVLLLEPDKKLATLYMAVLESAGYAVTWSATAQDAILQADAAIPDIVILELQLVAHSGIEFLYEFRSYVDWQNVPVVILSHVPPTEFAGNSNLLERQLGVRSYHYKPQTNLAALLRAVGNCMPEKQPL